MELKAENKEFTAKTLAERVKSPVKSKTVGEVFTFQIKSLKEQYRNKIYSHWHDECDVCMVELAGADKLILHDLNGVDVESDDYSLRFILTKIS